MPPDQMQEGSIFPCLVWGSSNTLDIVDMISKGVIIPRETRRIKEPFNSFPVTAQKNGDSRILNRARLGDIIHY